MKNKSRIIYWVSTALISLMMLGSAFNHIYNFDKMAEIYTRLGYPTHLIIPVAIAKVAAVLAILTRKWKWLTEWAYAGLCFELFLALGAHLAADDHDSGGAILGLILLFASYISWKWSFKIKMD